jgi:hypothetical protein
MSKSVQAYEPVILLRAFLGIFTVMALWHISATQ